MTFATVPVTAVTVCVEFGDILGMTIPLNRHHFERVLVVTHPEDEETIETAKLHQCQVLLTEIFYARGAKFNKWAALQQGIDFLNHDGWMLIMDSDIVIPRQPERQLTPEKDCLYTPRRKDCQILRNGVPKEQHWKRYKYVRHNEEFAGYFQLFHTGAPQLIQKPWFERHWSWAGTGDTIFQQRFHHTKQIRPAFDVLHLGLPHQNWAGRVQPYADGRTPENAAQRWQDFGVFQRQRRLNNGLDDRYRGEKLPKDEMP